LILEAGSGEGNEDAGGGEFWEMVVPLELAGGGIVV
jgi:hypothetical protein